MSVIQTTTTITAVNALNSRRGGSPVSSSDEAVFLWGFGALMAAGLAMIAFLFYTAFRPETPERAAAQAAFRAKTVSPSECAGRTIARVEVDGRYCRVYFADGKVLVVQGTKYPLRINQ